jgi:HAD superfamily hydrolase (TIGR01509 family)
MQDFWAEYKGTPNTGLIEYLAGLRQRCRTALLSNSFVGARERQQEVIGITDLVIYSHEVGISKPDRRIFDMTCRRLGVPTVHAVFVDDIELYVEAARKLGMHGVLFQNNEQVAAEIDAWLGSQNQQ